MFKVRMFAKKKFWPVMISLVFFMLFMLVYQKSNSGWAISTTERSEFNPVDSESQIVAASKAHLITNIPGSQERLGLSAHGSAFPIYQHGVEKNEIIFLLAAVDGLDQPGSFLLERLNAEITNAPYLIDGKTVYIIPVLNPDAAADIRFGAPPNTKMMDVFNALKMKSGQPLESLIKNIHEPELKNFLGLLKPYLNSDTPLRILVLSSHHSGLKFVAPEAELMQITQDLHRHLPFSVLQANVSNKTVKPIISEDIFASNLYYGFNIPVFSLGIPQQNGVQAWNQYRESLWSFILTDTPVRSKPEPVPTALAVIPKDALIEINKAQQKLYVRDANGSVLLTFPVSTARYSVSTPVGRFRIVNKYAGPAYYGRHGAYKGNDPRNPLGSRWMALNVGHFRSGVTIGIHGTNEPDKIGQAVSDGCIRMKNQDVENLFDLIRVGQPVYIHN